MKQTQCPKPLAPPVLHTLDRILAALPAVIARQLGYAVSRTNGTSYKGWQLEAAISLEDFSPAGEVPGAAHWRAVAAAHCGEQVAERSWLIVLTFPQMHLINSLGRFLVALTPQGWRLWAGV